MKDRKECGNCALYNYEQQGCVRTQTHQQPSDSCSSFIQEVPICEICGQMFIPPRNYIIEGEKIITACGQCSSALSTCKTCKNRDACDFQTNPINIPAQIQQRTQKGGMVIMQTVINPARIAETCEKNCTCWDPIDRVCNKQTEGTCGIGYKPSYLP